MEYTIKYVGGTGAKWSRKWSKFQIVNNSGIVVAEYGLWKEAGWDKLTRRNALVYSSDNFSHTPWSYLSDAEDWHLDYFLNNDKRIVESFVSYGEIKKHLIRKRIL